MTCNRYWRFFVAISSYLKLSSAALRSLKLSHAVLCYLKLSCAILLISTLTLPLTLTFKLCLLSCSFLISITIIQVRPSCGFGGPASLSSFKGINRKRDDILRWVALSDCAERFRNFAERFRNRSAKFRNRSAAPKWSKTAGPTKPHEART